VQSQKDARPVQLAKYQPADDKKNRHHFHIDFKPDEYKLIDIILQQSAYLEYINPKEEHGVAPKNKELADIFEQIADALEIRGETGFEVMAYRKAARVLDDLAEDIENMAREKRLMDLPGVGKGISKKIDEYLNTGKMKTHEEALSSIPEGLMRLLGIQNLGPRTIHLAHKELGVKDLGELKKAIDNGSLAELHGMGEKKVENIKKGIELFEQALDRIPGYQALIIADDVINHIKKAGIKSISPAGSLRRMKETVGDIDILATGREGEAIIAHFTRYPNAERVLSAGRTKGSIMAKTDAGLRQVDLRVVDEESYGAALLYFTGSKAHNIKLRGMAKDKGLKISEYGLFRGDTRIAGATEEEMYRALHLPWIPPELREDRGEIEMALEKKLPALLDYTDIRGDLHVQSGYRVDGSAIDELAEGAKKLGYDYIAICDHSQSAEYARGLSEEELKRQIAEIDEFNDLSKDIKILKGTEVDILSNGKLDFPDSLLEQLDLVIASIHTGFKHNVTARMIKAMQNPLVHAIAHPTGRLVSRREGYKVDLEKVMEAAAETGTFLELNANYNRLDLDELNLMKARNLGIHITIGTDTNSPSRLDMMRIGIGIARRGWLEKGDIVNTLPLEELKELLAR
jgi:DNA polymerase (family X)